MGHPSIIFILKFQKKLQNIHYLETPKSNPFIKKVEIL